MQAMTAAKHSKPTPPGALQQVNFRLALDVWLRLKAMAGVLGVTQSRVVSDAIHVYYASLPASTQRTIDQAAALRKKP